MSLSAGTRLGPYEIVALLGAGGMGAGRELPILKQAQAEYARRR